MQLNVFRSKQRDLLGDTVQGTYTFEDRALDGWRDDEVQLLFARGLFRRDTNFGTETTITSVDPVPSYYAMPSGFRRIIKVQFVSATDDTELSGLSYAFNDLERPGFVFIPEAGSFGGYKLRLFGEKEYTGVDDTIMKQEIIDVCLYGSVNRALNAEYMKRVQSRRSMATSRKADTSPNDLVSGMAMVERKLQKSVGNALAIQARTIMGF